MIYLEVENFGNLCNSKSLNGRNIKIKLYIRYLIIIFRFLFQLWNYVRIAMFVQFFSKERDMSEISKIFGIRNLWKKNETWEFIVDELLRWVIHPWPNKRRLKYIIDELICIISFFFLGWDNTRNLENSIILWYLKHFKNFIIYWKDWKI